MNKSFKSIWNEALGAWVAASELDRARGKRVASSRRAAEHVAQAGAAVRPGAHAGLSPGVS
ncbi:ESPR domain-containing protein [Burkholderia cenocepacia]|uniref:ESPR domain-containing protein n=1 Tax=Burkholderia cenocepacia TaxID=95486 RepID=UPI0020125924|nr:ESPR domain-containing protein [Burkholderia cenocepacia]